VVVVGKLSRTLFLSLDDQSQITRAFMHTEVSRSGLYRCLQRHGVSSLRDLMLKSERPPKRLFKDFETDFADIHIKFWPQVSDQTSRN
jgi:hypothetical protein